MKSLQGWTRTNLWGEVERWYRIPGHVSEALLESLGADSQVLAGSWASVLRGEMRVYDQRIWLSGHAGGQLLCASTDGQTPVVFAEIDVRLARLFGPLEELHAVAETELGTHIAERA